MTPLSFPLSGHALTWLPLHQVTSGEEEDEEEEEEEEEGF